MGIFSNFWNSVKNIFGIRKKQEEALRQEQTERVKLEDFKKPVENLPKIQEGKDYIKERQSSLEEEKRKEERDSIKLPKLPDVSESYKNNMQRAIRFGKGFQRITESDKENWNKEINPSNIPIITGFYGNKGDLEKSRFDIYRNIILANIKDNDLVQKIYRSGIIDEHIVGFIKLRIIGTKAGSKTIQEGIPQICLNAKPLAETNKSLDYYYKYYKGGVMCANQYIRCKFDNQRFLNDLREKIKW